MNRSFSRCLVVLTTVGLGAVALHAQAPQASYQPAGAGTRLLEGANGLMIKMLVEQSNLGGSEVEVGEITFPVGAGAARRGHRHQRVEILYVLDGTLDHIVNGESHLLSPGMVGIVRPGDAVVHRVASDTPVKALIIWAPGGEADRIAPGFTVKPIGRP